MSAVDECLQDVLLDVLVIVVSRELFPQLRKVFDRFIYAIVVDVVGRRLCSQNKMVTNILLDEAIAVMAADDGIGQMHIFDLGLQLTGVTARDLPSEDDGNLVWPPDGAIGIEQTFAHGIQCGPAVKDQVVAVLDLSKEEAVPAAGISALAGCEKG